MLLAGIVEGVIGVLLVSGLLTRVVILFMWVPFQLGVPFLPPQLLGHLPIFAIMYLLLVHGPGLTFSSLAKLVTGAAPSRPGPCAAPVQAREPRCFSASPASASPLKPGNGTGYPGQKETPGHPVHPVKSDLATDLAAPDPRIVGCVAVIG